MFAKATIVRTEPSVYIIPTNFSVVNSFRKLELIYAGNAILNANKKFVKNRALNARFLVLRVFFILSIIHQ